MTVSSGWTLDPPRTADPRRGYGETGSKKARGDYGPYPMTEAEADSRLSPLLRLARGGDEEAYREFLTVVGRMLRGYHRRALGASGAGAELLVQRTLIAIHLARFSPTRSGRVVAWVQGLARRELERFGVQVPDAERLDALLSGSVDEDVGGDAPDILSVLTAPFATARGQNPFERALRASRQALAGLGEWVRRRANSRRVPPSAPPWIAEEIGGSLPCFQVDHEEASARLILDALPDSVYATDAEGAIVYRNAAFRRVFEGRRPMGGDCPATTALSTARPVLDADLVIEGEGRRFEFSASAAPIFAPAGDVAGAVCVLADIGRRKAEERRRAVFARETRHRLNNALATVQAIADCTARGSDSLATFRAGFGARISAMAKAQTLLEEAPGRRATLLDLVRAGIAVFDDGTEGRVVVSGPPVALGEDRAIPLAMAIHELATNAAKYGALAGPEGNLRVEWRRPGSELEIVWREAGVPMWPERPERPASSGSGFGMRLLTKLIPGMIAGATVAVARRLDGVEARITIRDMATGHPG